MPYTKKIRHQETCRRTFLSQRQSKMFPLSMPDVKRLLEVQKLKLMNINEYDLKKLRKYIGFSNAFLDHEMPSTKAHSLWIVSLFGVGICVAPETLGLISRWSEQEIYLIRSGGWDSFREQLTLRSNVTSMGGLRFISQVIFPGLQDSHLNRYSHWHVAARTGWKHLYPALSRQWLGWFLQISPITVCTKSWSQVLLPSGSATWGPIVPFRRQTQSFVETHGMDRK